MLGRIYKLAQRQDISGPFGDSVDQRIIDNLVNRTGSLFNGVDYDNVSGFPAISWPELQGGKSAIDDDLDGMPDAWELLYFHTTRRGSQEISKRDFDRDGYTDVEEYLNRTNPIRPEDMPEKVAGR